MKNFKQFVTEEQYLTEAKEFDDLFMAMSLMVKLDPTNKKALFPYSGKIDTFRHITNLKGANFLILEPDPKVAISAMKFGKQCASIGTEGGVLLTVEGEYLYWSPRDSWTYRGKQNLRWVSILEAPGRHFPESYIQEMFNFILSEYRKLGTWFGEIITHLDRYNWEYNTKTHQRWFDYLQKIQSHFSSYMYKPDAKKMLKNIVNKQHELIEKYSTELQTNFIEVYNKMHNPQYIQKQFGKFKYYHDEAVIKKVKVTGVNFIVADNFRALLDVYQKGGNIAFKDNYNELRIHINEFINRWPFKTCTITDKNCSGAPIHEMIKMDKEASDIIFAEYGLKHVKGIVFERLT